MTGIWAPSEVATEAHGRGAWRMRDGFAHWLGSPCWRILNASLVTTKQETELGHKGKRSNAPWQAITIFIWQTENLFIPKFIWAVSLYIHGVLEMRSADYLGGNPKHLQANAHGCFCWLHCGLENMARTGAEIPKGTPCLVPCRCPELAWTRGCTGEHTNKRVRGTRMGSDCCS